ncbi:MAG: hypothetical protein WB808_14195 [Candidatus Dormiibacterota bacterium]
MIPVSYDMAKARMADRLREAERHRLVQQAKATAREERKADAELTGARRSVTSWFRPVRKVSHVSNASASGSTV